MKKYQSAPKPEESALDSARAALDRAGEVEPPVAAEPVDAAKAAEAPVPEPATPEASSDAPSADETETPPEPEAAANEEEASQEETPVEDAEAKEETEPEAAADEEEASEESDDEDSASTPEDSEEPDAAPQTDESDEDAEPEAPPPIGEPAADAEPEVTETERTTMETREFTLDYRPNGAPEEDYEDAPFEDDMDLEEEEYVREPKERRGKSRPKALKKLQAAFRRPERRKPDAEVKPSQGSSRDEALRNRVMQMEDAETRDYLLNRVLPQMTWYSKKSGQYKKQYQFFMTLTIGLSALIPVSALLTNYTAFKVIVALLGASVTGINAYLALQNYHDLWLTYRSTREDLIHTLYCYFNQAGIFALEKMTPQERNVMLVDLCEDALSKETGRWTTIIQSAPVSRRYNGI